MSIMTWEKSCFVPFCKVTGLKNPDKVFFCVPRNPVERYRWLKAVKRDPSTVSRNTRFYCCEDHFDVNKDVINFEGYKRQTGPFKVCFRYGAVPTKFDCFKNQKVRSIEELRKKRILISDETIKLFVDPNYTSNERDFSIREEVPSLTDLDNKIEKIRERVNLAETSRTGFTADGETTLHSLEEINQLLLDINNLGILSSALSAYEKVYKYQKKWALQFTLKNGRSSFDCLIRKVPNETDQERKDLPSTSNISYSTDKKIYQYKSQTGNGGENSHSVRSSFDEALIHGEHNYTNFIPPEMFELSNDDEFNKISIQKDPTVGSTLPDIATVHQCEYCSYGSLHKYRVRHHIKSKHKRRFSVFPEEFSSGSKTMNCTVQDLKNGNLTERTNLSEDNSFGEINVGELSESNIEDMIDYSLPLQNNVDCNKDVEHTHLVNTQSENESISKVKKGRRKKLSYYLSGGKALELKRLERQIQNKRDWLEDFVKSLSENKAKPTVKYPNVKKTYSCVLCDFTSTDQTEVFKHTGLTHVNGNSLYLECPCCDFKALDRIGLSNHLITFHFEDDFFKCKMCDYQTDSNEEYFSHICDAHTRKSLYRCLYCKFTCSKHDSLQKHITCTHKVQQDYFPYECDMCDFKTRVKHQFTMHYDSVHLKKKPHQCFFCNTRFAQRGHVVRHIQDIHLKEKPHLCTFCKYCTANRANLKSHLKAIHNISDEDVTEVLKTCVNLRKQDSRENDFNKIMFYDSVDLLPDEDSEASQIIQDIVMEVQ